MFKVLVLPPFNIWNMSNLNVQTLFPHLKKMGYFIIYSQILSQIQIKIYSTENHANTHKPFLGQSD